MRVVTTEPWRRAPSAALDFGGFWRGDLCEPFRGPEAAVFNATTAQGTSEYVTPPACTSLTGRILNTSPYVRGVIISRLPILLYLSTDSETGVKHRPSSVSYAGWAGCSLRRSPPRVLGILPLELLFEARIMFVPEPFQVLRNLNRTHVGSEDV